LGIITGVSEEDRDERFMGLAIEQARLAEGWGDVPIGAVIVRSEEVLSAAGNRRAADADPTAHAELLAIRAAARSAGDWRLSDCEMYVTLEPCVMCAGAIVLSRLARVVYGAADPKAGAARSLYRLLEDPRLNHRPAVAAGVLAEECGRMLTAFFQARRRLGKK
jgi:tRNA(adenine34) deaminase